MLFRSVPSSTGPRATSRQLIQTGIPQDQAEPGTRRPRGRAPEEVRIVRNAIAAVMLGTTEIDMKTSARMSAAKDLDSDGEETRQKIL